MIVDRPPPPEQIQLAVTVTIRPESASFFPLGHCRHPDHRGVYVADPGFEGRDRHLHWREAYGAVVELSDPSVQLPSLPGHVTSVSGWPALRLIIETVNGFLQRVFRLERRYGLTENLFGFQVRLAAKMALSQCLPWAQPAGRTCTALIC